MIIFSDTGKLKAIIIAIRRTFVNMLSLNLLYINMKFEIFFKKIKISASYFKESIFSLLQIYTFSVRAAISFTLRTPEKSYKSPGFPIHGFLQKQPAFSTPDAIPAPPPSVPESGR